MTNRETRESDAVIAHQGLQVGQLIYTSFRQSGFTLLKSADIPPAAQHIFLNKLVQAHWDTYAPPNPGYRAAYLRQLPLTTPGTLFGWLYHDGQDEFGRADVPYFIAYYLPAQLQANQLSQVVTCLQQGPVEWLDRAEMPPSEIKPLTIYDVHSYHAARSGVGLPAQLRVEAYTSIESQTPLNWFYTRQEAATQVITWEESTADIHSPQSELPQDHQSHVGGTTSNLSAIENILQQLIAKPIGTQGVALVSAEGQSIVPPIGIDENATGILAGTMLRLLRLAQEELHWQHSETVSVRGQEGYLLLTGCSADTYLLVKSEKVPLGLLEGEVNRAVDKLRVALAVLEVDPLPAISLLLEPGATTLPRPDTIPNSHAPAEDNTHPSSLEALDWSLSDQEEISAR